MWKSELSALKIEDLAAVEGLEHATGLTFWGRENYRRFLQVFPEYFGTKALVYHDSRPGVLAGFVLARSIFENLEILKMGVSPEFHRQGIGTLLMKSAYSEGVKRGCHRCFLEVRRSNDAAIRFYYAHKFRVAGVRKDYYTDPVEDAWIMERDF